MVCGGAAGGRAGGIREAGTMSTEKAGARLTEIQPFAVSKVPSLEKGRGSKGNVCVMDLWVAISITLTSHFAAPRYRLLLPRGKRNDRCRSLAWKETSPTRLLA